ncbi:class I adenylate-forming enzyme family protein [Cupriavidus sp. 2TAF22]|uniref:class I adenylate-forming enzyme family protein n=1 Tax=unclassified Cupriavidus TaxID=2640874 RepID=UPI003F8E9B3D
MRLADYFDAAASRFADDLAFIDGATHVTFAQARRFVHAVAHGLNADKALSPGAHIAIYAPNDYRISLLQIAANRADMAWISVHTRNAVETNIAVLDYADCEAILFHSAYENAVLALKAGLPRVRKFICIDQPSAHGDCLQDWLDAYREPFRAPPENPDQTMLLQPTGGTTGPSKGAEHTHRSYEIALINVYESLQLERASRVLAVAPLTHAAAIVTLAGAIRGGRTVVLPGFDPKTVLEVIQREGITHMFLPPTVLYALLADPAIATADLSSLRCLLVGGAPIAPERMREAVERFGPVVHEVYGQSECGMPVIFKRPQDYLLPNGSFDDAALRSAGKGTPLACVEIMDDDGNLLGPGEKGEIVVRSTMVMKGYYKMPEETAQVSTFGWHHTTDIGIRDERGFITIVDRRKDMIVSGGFNVFPSEIEAVILNNPAVLDCAVIGVPDPKWGEAVKAIVQVKPGHEVMAEELMAQCKQVLGGVKAPKSVEFWTDLPRSAVGKVLKRQIRDKFWEGHWRAV